MDHIFFFFFFQAEDGIRDSSVTGVQTCALPILAHRDSVNSLSCTIVTSLPIRRKTSRHVAIVSSDVCGMRTNSSASTCPAKDTKRKPMHRSGQNVIAAKSAMETSREVLAKIAFGLANLSKIVNISIL